MMKYGWHKFQIFELCLEDNQKQLGMISLLSQVLPDKKKLNLDKAARILLHPCDVNVYVVPRSK